MYFRDLYDHVVRIHDISESLRDLIAGTLETYLSVVSNRTNDIMKTLTIVTVMFMPMSFLVGFFGMNFFGETLAFTAPLPRALLFWGSCAIMAISPCFIWIYARGGSGSDAADGGLDVNARWRIVPHDSGRIIELEPRRRHLAPGGAAPAQPRDRRPGARPGVPVSQAGESARPGAASPAPLEAAERLVRAIQDDRKIVIYGDYDVDGVCGTSILWGCLRLAGARRLEYYIPHRVEEGYGLSAEALRRLAKEGGAELIVTVDCGISAVREAELARARRRADRHRPPHDRQALCRGRRGRASAAAGQPLPQRATCAARPSRSSWRGRSARASATASAHHLNCAST